MLLVTFLLSSSTRHATCFGAIAENPLPPLPLDVYLILSTTRAIISVVLRKVLVVVFGRDKVLPPRQWRFMILLIVAV